MIVIVIRPMKKMRMYISEEAGELMRGEVGKSDPTIPMYDTYTHTHTHVRKV